jgi:hypothetical protein
MPENNAELERAASFWRVIYEHKFLIVFISLVVISRTKYPPGSCPWFIILPAVPAMLIGFWEALKSRFSLLKYAAFAILIYACITWVLGSGLEMSPVSRW